MAGVPAHVLQVVVLPPGAHTLLAVHHPPVPRQLAPGVRRAQENGLKLVHARVDEEEAGVAAGPHGGGGQAAVAVPLLEEAQEGGAGPAAG